MSVSNSLDRIRCEARASALSLRAPNCYLYYLHSATLIPSIRNIRLNIASILKGRATKFVRFTANGMMALWISNNYTQPVIDGWRGRDSNNTMVDELTPWPARTTVKREEPKLVYDYRTWP
jgi:hypothetical protein